MLATLLLAATVPLLPEWSPAYFWMWNTKLEPAKLNAQLDDMVAHGLKSVCVHPWPKTFRPVTMPSEMSPEYLSDDYLGILRQVFDHGAARGMNLWLYDEGGWPSGGAAGQVVASDATGAFCPQFLRPDGKGGFNLRKKADYRRHGWSAPLPSVLEPGATARFIDITHERLKKAVGHHFGKAVKFTFTDEPCYPRANRASGFAALTWASDFAAEFKRRRGYAFVADDELLDVGGRVSARRVDYLETLAELFAERYLEPLRSWSRANGLLSGGHFGGEDHFWECHQHGAGDLLLSLDTLDLPGVDVIWRQLAPGGEPLPFPRFAASVAHQNGRAHVLSESFGIYGNGVTPALWKWLVDYQLVRGVNTFVFAYLQADNSGPWMTRIEPLGGPVRPEWDFLRPFHEYVHARSAALGRGRSAAETAVLYDVRDIWAGGADRERAATNQVVVSRRLDRRHVDYDFVSDRKVAAAGIADGRLTVGRMAYRTLVLPHSKWLTDAAKARIAAFERAGGRVIRGTDVSSVPETVRVTGEGSGDIRVLKRLTDSGETLFFANESTEPRRVRLTVGAREVDWSFAGCGSALFVDGRALDEPEGPLPAGGGETVLADGWTFRALRSYALGENDIEIRDRTDPPAPVSLGDWRGRLGESFSGIAAYRCAFTAKGGAATLDLGKVGWTCRAWLNGAELKPRFFGPFRWPVKLAEGRNVLEVHVANTLANATGDPAVRDRVAKRHPPRSPYEDRQRAFDRENHESGLFGPVVLRPLPAAPAAAPDAAAPRDEATEAWTKWRKVTDARIAAIRATPNLTPPAGADVYYLSPSGDDARDGRSPQNAWRTVQHLNRQKGIRPGSCVLFERGGLWRVTLDVPNWPAEKPFMGYAGGLQGRAGVTYSAYGAGPKPRFTTSPFDGADPTRWQATDAPGVWACAIGRTDVGNVVFDGGAAHGIKILPVYNKDGSTTAQYTKLPFRDYRDLTGDLHFYHDYSTNGIGRGTGFLYLRSKENPGARFKSIEFGLRHNIITSHGQSDVVYDNLCLLYGGAHGIHHGGAKNLTVRNCEFGWIGGGIQGEGLFGRAWGVRYGNAVETGDCDGFTVTNCYVYQIYDAGLTHQADVTSRFNGRENVRYQKRIRYVGNVIEKCNYSIEYFLSNCPGRNPSRMEDYLVADNLMWEAGRGLCEQRPDTRQDAHLKSWESSNRATGYVIRNNVFAGAHRQCVQICSRLTNPDGSTSLPRFENNVFLAPKTARFGTVAQIAPGERPASWPIDAETEARVNRFGAGNRVYALPAE